MRARGGRRAQAGRRGEALEKFREAEAVQSEQQPPSSPLCSLPGFRSCDLLLGEGEGRERPRNTDPYCSRSATTGSMRLARSAGRRMAR